LLQLIAMMRSNFDHSAQGTRSHVQLRDYEILHEVVVRDGRTLGKHNADEFIGRFLIFDLREVLHDDLHRSGDISSSLFVRQKIHQKRNDHITIR